MKSMFKMTDDRNNTLVMGFVDPLDKYPKASQEALMEACGFIPYFVADAAEDSTAAAALNTMEGVYGFPAMPMTGGEVSVEGVYSYPEDPDLYPLVAMATEGGVEVLVYRHAIVVVRDEKETFVTRMD